MSIKKKLEYDFNLKDDFLRGLFEEVDPFTFYESLFSDKDIYTDKCVVTYGSDEDLEVRMHNPIQKTVKAMTFEEAIVNSRDYANMYLPPCTFFNNHNSTKCLENLYAIVVDFDGDKNGVSIPMIKWLAERIEESDDKFPSPSFIANSGNGLHLFWVFDKPVPMFKQNKRLMKDLYMAMHQLLIDMYTKPQRHHFGQAYRIIGSKTKLDTVATAFRTGETYDAGKLMKYFKVEGTLFWSEDVIAYTERKPSEPMLKLANNIEAKLGVVCENKESWKYVHGYIKENKPAFDSINMKNPSVRFRKKEGEGWGSVAWYNRMKRAIIQETPEGYRYTSLMAFFVIGYKCNIPFEQVKKDEDEIILFWQLRPKPFDHRFNDEYRDRVDDCYSEKYKKTTKARLEEWLGFKMHSTVRRNGRTRDLHLKGARAIQAVNDEANGTNWRDGNGRKSKKDLIQEWKKEHPKGTQKDCSIETGITIKTVNKWWNGASPLEQIQKWKKEHPNGSKYQCIKETGISKPTVYKWWDVDKKEVNTGISPIEKIEFKPKLVNTSIIEFVKSSVLPNMNVPEGKTPYLLSKYKIGKQIPKKDRTTMKPTDLEIQAINSAFDHSDDTFKDENGNTVVYTYYNELNPTAKRDDAMMDEFLKYAWKVLEKGKEEFISPALSVLEDMYKLGIISENEYKIKKEEIVIPSES